MKAERGERFIVVSLTREEVFSVQAGRTIGDRPGVILPESKIEVLPLSAVEEDNSLNDRWAIDRLDKGLAAPLKANLFPNGDLQIFVPAIKLADVRISHARLPRESIKTPMTEEKDHKEYVSMTIPEKGVIVNFGGSLRIIEIGPAT